MSPRQCRTPSFVAVTSAKLPAPNTERFLEAQGPCSAYRMGPGGLGDSMGLGAALHLFPSTGDQEVVAPTRHCLKGRRERDQGEGPSSGHPLPSGSPSGFCCPGTGGGPSRSGIFGEQWPRSSPRRLCRARRPPLMFSLSPKRWFRRLPGAAAPIPAPPPLPQHRVPPGFIPFRQDSGAEPGAARVGPAPPHRSGHAAAQPVPNPLFDLGSPPGTGFLGEPGLKTSPQLPINTGAPPGSESAGRLGEGLTTTARFLPWGAPTERDSAGPFPAGAEPRSLMAVGWGCPRPRPHPMTAMSRR